MARLRRATVLLLLPLLLAACQVELHRGLNEREANEIVAVLLRGGIAASRVPDGANALAVRVPDSRFADAVDALRAHGLPRPRFASMGEVFPSGGLVASPVQERARMVHALNQELSRTISEVDGVVSARVHVVLPEPDPLRREPGPASASVLVRHEAEAPVGALVPHIKMRVSNGVANLSYDRVSVALVAVPPPPAPVPPAFVSVAGLRVEPASAEALRLVLVAAAGLLLGMLALGAALLWRRLAARPASRALVP